MFFCATFSLYIPPIDEETSWRCAARWANFLRAEQRTGQHRIRQCREETTESRTARSRSRGRSSRHAPRCQRTTRTSCRKRTQSTTSCRSFGCSRSSSRSFPTKVFAQSLSHAFVYVLYRPRCGHGEPYLTPTGSAVCRQKWAHAAAVQQAGLRNL